MHEAPQHRQLQPEVPVFVDIQRMIEVRASSTCALGVEQRGMNGHAIAQQQLPRLERLVK